MFHDEMEPVMSVESLVLLAQYDTARQAGALAAAGSLCMCVGFVVLLPAIIAIAGMWKTFAKAGKPGWASIVPIYNAIVLLEIVDRPTWWLLILILLPPVNVVLAIVISIDLARNFGKDTLFGIALFLLPFIFYPVLGFGDAQYRRVPHY